MKQVCTSPRPCTKHFSCLHSFAFWSGSRPEEICLLCGVGGNSILVKHNGVMGWSRDPCSSSSSSTTRLGPPEPSAGSKVLPPRMETCHPSLAADNCQRSLSVGVINAALQQDNKTWVTGCTNLNANYGESRGFKDYKSTGGHGGEGVSFSEWLWHVISSHPATVPAASHQLPISSRDIIVN